MKNFLWLISIAPILCFAQEYVDNTNSAGLSSMQRAIDAQDIPRMEGLIQSGAGYYWWILGRDDWGTKKESPLINYAISNNKPKAIDFLLSKQTVADASTVMLAMEKANYTLVKKLIEDSHLGALLTTDIPVTNVETKPEGNFFGIPFLTTIKEQVPVESYYSNWQLSYIWLNAAGESQSNTVGLGTNTYKSLEKQIAKIMKEQKQKGKLLEYSSNSISVITNTAMKTQMRKIEALSTNQYRTVSSNVLELQSIALTKSENTELAKLAAAQNSIPMVDYFLDKGADINDGLLHCAVYWGNTAMVKLLIEKGANVLEEVRLRSLFDENERMLGIVDERAEGTSLALVEFLIQEIDTIPNRVQRYSEPAVRLLFSQAVPIHYLDQYIENSKKKLPEYKKRLPQWKEILTILKKYEE